MLVACRLRGVVVSLVATVLAAGCQYGPGDDIYDLAVARIGDAYHVYAPLCSDEHLETVRVYDNDAVGHGRPGPHEYWKVATPATDQTARGWVALGDDKSFQTVEVAAGSLIPFPKLAGVQLAGTSGNGRFSVDVAVVTTGDIPTYPAGTDPTTIKYALRVPDGKPALLTPQEVDGRLKCARDYVA